ncbi:MAG: hypothetical protein HPY74_01455 [Firmicutes bacterium]|nr:hypothetical protein [Bacillota bacterium]
MDIRRLIFISERGITYISFVEGFKKDGCVICNNVFNSTLRYFRYLLDENVNDLSTRIRFYNSIGYCNRHAWILKKIGETEYDNNLGQTIMYEGLIEKVINSIENIKLKNEQLTLHLNKRKNKKANKYLNSLLRKCECAVCQNEHEAESRHLEFFVEYFTDPDVFKYYNNSKGLCYDHFVKVLPLMEFEQRQKLIDNYIEKLKTLQNRLNEYMRKMDYRFSNEPKGDEQTAWIDAIRIISGNNISIL